MIESTLLYGFLIALSMGLGALGVFVWAALGGQMDDAEDIKYRILAREIDGDGDDE
jgi:cbb3-type cytochrome oxidase maturation protein